MSFWEFGDEEREGNEKRGRGTRQLRLRAREAVSKNDSWNLHSDLAIDKEASLIFQTDIYFKSHQGKMWP